jgi:hypothetical protein
MTTEYTWVISQMDTKVQEGNLNDVVVKIYWGRQVVAIDGDNKYYANKFDAMYCSAPSETDFTAYPDLTFEQVCGWLEAGLDVAQIDADLHAKIQSQINPPIVILPNPWEDPIAIEPAIV